MANYAVFDAIYVNAINNEGFCDIASQNAPIKDNEGFSELFKIK